eukprot:3327085-Pleurochrysis_carterae.AAC.1
MHRLLACVWPDLQELYAQKGDQLCWQLAYTHRQKCSFREIISTCYTNVDSNAKRDRVCQWKRR